MNVEAQSNLQAYLEQNQIPPAEFALHDLRNVLGTITSALDQTKHWLFQPKTYQGDPQNFLKSVAAFRNNEAPNWQNAIAPWIEQGYLPKTAASKFQILVEEDLLTVLGLSAGVLANINTPEIMDLWLEALLQKQIDLNTIARYFDLSLPPDQNLLLSGPAAVMAFNLMHNAVKFGLGLQPPVAVAVETQPDNKVTTLVVTNASISSLNAPNSQSNTGLGTKIIGFYQQRYEHYGWKVTQEDRKVDQPNQSPTWLITSSFTFSNAGFTSS